MLSEPAREATLVDTVDLDQLSDQEDLSSDEEFENNRVGDIPIEWYEDLDHIGYDVTGATIPKSDQAWTTDKIDKAIAASDDPMFNRTIFDEKNNESIVLTSRELNLVNRMMRSRYTNETPTFQAEQEFAPVFSSIPRELPLNKTSSEPKRRFMPSLHEKQKIFRILEGIREGRISFEKEPKDYLPFLLWNSNNKIIGDSDKLQRKRPRISAPKSEVPGHAHSYHPPKEYLDDQEETLKDYQKIRYIPRYEGAVQERFDRCLDLYLATRVTRDKLTIDPETLVPKLPPISSLRPFPNSLSHSYFSHSADVLGLSFNKDGQYVISFDVQGCVNIWETETGFCCKKIEIPQSSDDGLAEQVLKAEINPLLPILCVCTTLKVYLFDVSKVISHGDEALCLKVQEYFSNGNEQGGEVNANNTRWTAADSSLVLAASSDKVKCFNDICWHSKGYYLVTCGESSTFSGSRVSIHNLATKESKVVFSKSNQMAKQKVQRVCFHPFAPLMFVAAQDTIFCYHLVKRNVQKKLYGGTKSLSTIAIDRTGGHLVSGGNDNRMSWFDVELQEQPFKSMNYSNSPIGLVQFHPRYPLLLGCNRNSIQIFHASPSQKFTEVSLIVPVKNIDRTSSSGGGSAFHPYLPWVCMANGSTIVLVQNIP